MLLRDRVYDPYGVVVAFDGLTAETVAGVPEAIARFLRSSAGAMVRRDRAFAGDPDAFATTLRALVERLPDGASLQDLVVRAAASRGTAPIAIVTCGHAIAVRVPHGAMDGRGTIEFYRFVIDSAAGGTPSLDRRPRPPLPYLRMLTEHVRPTAVRAYLAERAAAVPGPVARTPSDEDVALRTARFETFVLTEAEVALLQACERRGTSSSARLGSLAIGTLRRVYRGAHDIPVQIPVDLRRWAPAGRIDGNFIGVAPLGSLLGTDWSAQELGSRIREAVKARTPIIRSLHAMAWQVKDAPKRRLRRLLRRPAGPGRLGISVSMLIDPTDYIDAAWLPDVPRRVGAATIGPWPSSTFVSIVQSAGRIRMTVWDESGEFDLDRFREALLEELDALQRA